MKNNKLKKLENLKLRTSTFGLKNKLGIIAIVCLLIASGVNATIKLGNDGTTDWSMVDTDKIRTSNGKSFPATGAGIQDGIWSLNGTGGIVDVPLGNYNIDFDMNLSHVVLKGAGSGNFRSYDDASIFSSKTKLILSDTSNITIHRGGKLRSVYVYVSTNYDGEAIVVEGEQYFVGEVGVLRDVTVEKTSCNNGTGITIRARNGNTNYIMLSSFENINVRGFYIGMVTKNDGSGAYVSGNIYSDLTFDANGRPLITYDSGGTYSNIQMSAKHPSGTIEGIRSWGAGIMFSNVMCWDWNKASGLCLNISGDKSYAEGYFCDKINNSGNDSIIQDISTGTTFGNSETVATFTVSSDTSEDSDLADYVCDGVADQDTIHLAIAALPTGGGRIVLKEGTYYFNGQFNTSTKDNWILQGQGSNTILLLSSDIGAEKMVYVMSSNFVMRDLQINSNNKTCNNVITITGDAINCRIDNCYITAGQCNDYGIYMYSQNSKGGVIENCNIWGCNYAIYANTNNVSIINNRIHGNKPTGIAFGNRHKIIGNNIYGNEYGIFNVNETLITNNFIYNNSIYAIFIQSPREDIRVSENTFYGNTADISISGNHNNLIFGNTGVYTFFPTTNLTAGSSVVSGFAWFEISTNILNIYNGTAWVSTTLT